jgi:hypothetical protein
MEQMSIWDILDEEKSDFPCDTYKHDVKGCCDYNEPLGKTYVLGSAYETTEEEEPLQDCGRRCDCALFSLNCYIKRGYVRVDGKWVRNEDGSIMIIGGECDWKPSEPWTRIEEDMTVAWWKSSLKEYKPNICEPECIDHIARGAINEQPAWIGIGTYVSGLYEEYTELVPKYYKLTNDFTKGE